MKTKTSVVILSLMLLTLISATMPLAAADYDLVIVNGRVMDPESGFDAVRNVGVRDGKIVAITDPKTGKMVTAWDTPWETMNTHPRTVGAHAKVLRLTREKKVNLTLMQAISKMSYQYAKFLQENGVAQMAFKGRLQEGADADITIFDPETVTDNSSLKKGENALPSTGIPYVLVNGTLVVKDSKVRKDVFPGRAIRAPVRN